MAGRKPGKSRKPSIGRLPRLNLRKREKKELQARMKKMTGSLWADVFRKIEPVAIEEEVERVRKELGSHFQDMDAETIALGAQIFRRHYPFARDRKKVIDMLVEEPKLLVSMPDIPAFQSEWCRAWLSERIKQETFKRLPKEKQVELATSAALLRKAEGEKRRQAFLRNVFHKYVKFLKGYRKQNNGQDPPKKVEKGALTVIYEKTFKSPYK